MNGKNYDLDKKELKEILTSEVLINFYKNNLENFISNFNQEIKDDNNFKKLIESYIDNYNIYFCVINSNKYTFTLFNGNIYLNSIYLKDILRKK